MRCLIVSTSGILFDKDVRSVVMPSVSGELGVLDNHVPFVCILKKGRVRISFEAEAGGETYDIDGGYARVVDNKLTILTGEQDLIAG